MSPAAASCSNPAELSPSLTRSFERRAWSIVDGCGGGHECGSCMPLQQPRLVHSSKAWTDGRPGFWCGSWRRSPCHQLRSVRQHPCVWRAVVWFRTRLPRSCSRSVTGRWRSNGKAFQIEATDENDLEAAMVVLHGGTHIERDEEERSIVAPYISWDKRWKVGWLLKLELSESNRSNFEANSVANWKPMQIWKDRCDVAEPRFLCDNSSKSILDTLKASQILNGCASQERVAEIK